MRFLSAFVFSLFLLPPAHAQWVRIDAPALPQNGIFAVSAVVASDEAVHALTNLGSNRVYRSTDDGSTWTLVPSVDVASGLYGAEATVVALQPGTALHVSVDAGLTWTRRAAAAAPLDNYFAGLARVDAGGRAHAFLSNTNPNRLYVTRDDFATVEPKLSSEAIGRVVSNGRVLVATNGSTPSAGYFRSTDGGQNWAAAAAPGLGSQYLYASRDSFFVSGVAPSSGARVLVASADGTAWTQVATGAVLGVAPALASSARHSVVFELGGAPSGLYASVRSGRQPVNVTDNYPACFPSGAFVAVSSRYAYALAQCTQTGAAVLNALYRRPIDGAVVAEAEAPADAGLAIGTPVPQPANHTASLPVTLLHPQSVTVHLYDVLGRRVAVVHEGLLRAGTHTLRVDVAPLPAGVYVVRATIGSRVVSRRLVVAR